MAATQLSLRTTWENFRGIPRAAWKPVVMILGVMAVLQGLLVTWLVADLTPGEMPSAGMIVSLSLISLLIVPLQYAVMRVILAADMGIQPTPAMVFDRFIGRVLLPTIAFGIACFLGWSILIAPLAYAIYTGTAKFLAIALLIPVVLAMVWLGVRLYLILAVLAFEDCRLIDAIKRSWQLTESQVWRIVGVFIVTILVMTVFSAAVGLILGLISIPLLLSGSDALILAWTVLCQSVNAFISLGSIQLLSIAVYRTLWRRHAEMSAA